MGKNDIIHTIKRSCLMCSTYKGFSPVKSDQSRNKVLDNLDKLESIYSNLYDELRRQDAEVSDIKKAKSNKILCMDSVDTCKACDRSIDRVNRMLMKLDN